MANMKPLLVALIFVSTAFADLKTIVKQSGDNLTLSCVFAPLPAKWFFNNEAIKESKLTGPNEGMYNSTVSKEDINSTHAGFYDCQNSSGVSLSSFNVTVVSIVTESTELKKGSTDSIELSCRLENDNVQVKPLSWTKNGLDLANATSDRITFTHSDKASTLNISQPNATDAGLYKCVVQLEDGEETKFEQSVSVNMAPEVQPIEKLRSRVEDEVAKITCDVTGYPVPSIRWMRKLDEQDEFTAIKYDIRINTSANTDMVPNAVLTVRKLTIKEDKGDYMCVAENEFGMSNTTVALKVKDKLAAVWPFLGICAEVAILCAVIFIFEKRRSRKLEEEEEVDAVKQDLMNQANGEDHELRQRNAVKS